MKKAQWEKDNDDLTCIAGFLMAIFLMCGGCWMIDATSVPVLIDAPQIEIHEPIEGWKT